VRHGVHHVEPMQRGDRWWLAAAADVVDATGAVLGVLEATGGGTGAVAARSLNRSSCSTTRGVLAAPCRTVRSKSAKAVQ